MNMKTFMYENFLLEYGTGFISQSRGSPADYRLSLPPCTQAD